MRFGQSCQRDGLQNSALLTALSPHLFREVADSCKQGMFSTNSAATTKRPNQLIVFIKQITSLIVAGCLLLGLAASSRAAIYLDATNDLFAGANAPQLDITSVVVTNDSANLHFTINVAGNLVLTNWGGYAIALFTGPGGATNSTGTTNAISLTEGINYWVNCLGWGNPQLWQYNTNTLTWTNIGGATFANSSSSVSLTVPYASIGLASGAIFQFDAYTFSGTGGAMDDLANPTQAINWWSAGYTNNLVETYPVLNGSNLTTTAIQATGANWTAAIWQVNGTGPMLTPLSGNTFECITTGAAFGNNGNTIIRSPQSNGVWTFPGDSLTIDANTEIRFSTGTKTKGTAASPSTGTNLFPSVSGNPGLILNGGVLSISQPYTVASLGGVLQVNAQSYLSAGTNGGGITQTGAVFVVNAQLKGTNSLVIMQGGDLSNSNLFTCPSNTFSGQWIVKAGDLVGTVANALGTNSITVNPQYNLGLTLTTNIAGPAQLDVGYNLNSAGVLTLTNGGRMALHQDCCFTAVNIEGSSLTTGIHFYSELHSNFPNNFPAWPVGGSGSLTIQPYGAPRILSGLKGAGSGPAVGLAAQPGGINNANLKWWYDWAPSPGMSGAIGEFVPMIWGTNNYNLADLAAATNTGASAILTFNEPDYTNQSNITVTQALAMWPLIQKYADAANMRLGSPADTSGGFRQGSWIDQFLQGCRSNGFRVDFICIHDYQFTGNPSVDTSNLQSDLVWIYNYYHLPIWLTEYDLMGSGFILSYWNPTNEALFAAASATMLQTLPFVERYAWYLDDPGGPGGYSSSTLCNPAGNNTVVGTAWWQADAGTGGTLSATSASVQAPVNLTTEGTLDWAQWGLINTNSFNHKAGVTSQIGNFIPFRTSGIRQSSNNTAAFSWSDGTPTASVTETTSDICRSLDSWTVTNVGFLFSVSASTNTEVLKVYVGAYAAQMQFEASLSDGSAPIYIDTSFGNQGTGLNRVYTLTFASASPGQTLSVFFFNTANNQANGFVSLAAATLAPNATTNSAVITPSIVAQPVSQTALQGFGANFSVVSLGSSLAYQWQGGPVGGPYANLSDSASISGATGATLTLTNVTQNMAGSYQVIINNSAGSITSAPVALAVKALTGVWTANFDLDLSLDVDELSPGTYTYSGPGVVGTGTFWNSIPIGGPLYWGGGSGSSVQGLLDDGTTATPINIGVTFGASGATGSPSDNPQTAKYLLNKYADGGSFTFNNVPNGYYNLALFGCDGAFNNLNNTFSVGTNSLSCVNTSAGYPNFVSRNNYVIFTNLWVQGGSLSGSFTGAFNGAQLQSSALNIPVLVGLQQMVGGIIILTWSQGALLETTNLARNVWVSVPGVSSPYTNLFPMNSPQTFYRVQVQ